MLSMDLANPAVAFGANGISRPTRSGPFWTEPRALSAKPGEASATIHVIDQDEDGPAVMRSWLASAGLGLRVYSSVDSFLNSPQRDCPGCLVVDIEQAQAEEGGLSRILLQLAQRYPVIVAGLADIPTTVRMMKAGAYDCVEKAYYEPDIIEVLRAAVALDQDQRLAQAHGEALRAQFDTLSPRERQVMALVTSGLLNKQVGGRLGVAENTVKAHRGAMMRKMGAATLAELVRMADSIGEACKSCAST